MKINLLQDEHLQDSPTAAKALAEIDTVLIEKHLAQGRRGYLGASGVGNPCARAVQFDYMKADKNEARLHPPARILRIFARQTHIDCSFHISSSRRLRACSQSSETESPTHARDAPLGIRQTD